jgi:hypothetical protein
VVTATRNPSTQPEQAIGHEHHRQRPHLFACNAVSGLQHQTLAGAAEGLKHVFV